MRKFQVSIITALLAAGCTPEKVGPYAADADDRAIQRQAAQKLMCRIENQERCSHLIQNRAVFSRFFDPLNTGTMTQTEKFKGRQITTKYVAEALAEIKQCQTVGEESIAIIKGLKLDEKLYQVRATSPLSEQTSACFIDNYTQEF